VSLYIAGDDRTGSYHSAAANAHPISNDGSGANPDVIFHCDALSSDTLLDKRAIRIREYVVDGSQLHKGGGVYPVTDLDTALPSQHVELADQAILPDLYAGMWQVAKVVNMQLCVVHDEGVISDSDASGAGVQIHAFIQIHAAPQVDLVGEPDAHALFDGREAVHVHDEPVDCCSDPNTDNRGDPSE
jgi:hypothetical protein